MLKKKQRDLERKVSNHDNYLKECSEKFDLNKKGKRIKMTFKCSTCNTAGWNKLPEIKAAAQINLKEKVKRRKLRRTSDYSLSSSGEY